MSRIVLWSISVTLVGIVNFIALVDGNIAEICLIIVVLVFTSIETKNSTISSGAYLGFLLCICSLLLRIITGILLDYDTESDDGMNISISTMVIAGILQAIVYTTVVVLIGLLIKFITRNKIRSTDVR